MEKTQKQLDEVVVRYDGVVVRYDEGVVRYDGVVVRYEKTLNTKPSVSYFHPCPITGVNIPLKKLFFKIIFIFILISFYFQKESYTVHSPVCVCVGCCVSVLKTV